MPEGMHLPATYTLRFAALDASGADVSGVVVTTASLLVSQVSAGTPDELQSGPFMLVPGPSSG